MRLAVTHWNYVLRLQDGSRADNPCGCQALGVCLNCPTGAAWLCTPLVQLMLCSVKFRFFPCESSALTATSQRNLNMANIADRFYFCVVPIVRLHLTANRPGDCAHDATSPYKPQSRSTTCTRKPQQLCRSCSSIVVDPMMSWRCILRPFG